MPFSRNSMQCICPIQRHAMLMNLLRLLFLPPLNPFPNSIELSMVLYFVPSLFTTSSSNLIKNTVFPGHMPPSSPALCALTPALQPTPQQTPSIIPATYAAQFNCDISFGTDIYWLTKGSLSEIMYSWLLVEELSMESAERAKRCRQRVWAMNCRSGRMRVGRGAGWVGVEERRRRRGRRRWPRG